MTARCMSLGSVLIGRLGTVATRQYSTVVADGSTVSVLAKALPTSVTPKYPADLRPAVLDKLEKSFLYENLNSTNKRLLFRESRAYIVESEGVIVKGKRLYPTKYPGLPAIKDLTTLIATSETPESLLVARKFLTEYVSHANSRPNIEPMHLALFLRKAGELGEFSASAHFLTSQSHLFKDLLTPEVYLEALRVVAARVPELSHRSRSSFLKYWTRSPKDKLGRELVMLYALTEYRKKFGPGAMGITKTLKRAIELAKRDGTSSDAVSVVDVAFGSAAARSLGQAGAELLDLLEMTQPESDTRKENVIYTVKVTPKPAKQVLKSAAEAETSLAESEAKKEAN